MTLVSIDSQAEWEDGADGYTPNAGVEAYVDLDTFPGWYHNAESDQLSKIEYDNLNLTQETNLQTLSWTFSGTGGESGCVFIKSGDKWYPVDPDVPENVNSGYAVALGTVDLTSPPVGDPVLPSRSVRIRLHQWTEV